jgi:hypothetical protein
VIEQRYNQIENCGIKNWKITMENAVIHWLKEGPSWLLFALETQ